MENKVLDILKQVLELPAVDETCSQKTCAEWDSMHHLNLMVELEMEFDVSLEPEDMAQMQSYNDIIKILKSKIQ